MTFSDYCLFGLRSKNYGWERRVWHRKRCFCDYLVFSLENVGFTDAFVVDPHWISGSIWNNQNYIFCKKLHFYELERKPNSVGIHLKSSAIDVSRGVDIIYTNFFENRSVVIEIESSKVKSNTGEIFPAQRSSLASPFKLTRAPVTPP